jgi:5-methylcytosine-specific restriction endonuclease McrA
MEVSPRGDAILHTPLEHSMETLVLSAAYEPMEIVSWQRAITLFVMEKVEVVEEYQDRKIRTVRLELAMPSIIRFHKALRSRKKAVKFSRQNVYARDRGRCQYCGQRVPRHQATYDHVLPRAQSGKTTWDNVVIACMRCNQRKGNRVPAKAGMRLLSTPVKPKVVPGGMGLTVTYNKGMPAVWKQYLADMSYWYGELEGE